MGDLLSCRFSPSLKAALACSRANPSGLVQVCLWFLQVLGAVQQHNSAVDPKLPGKVASLEAAIEKLQKDQKQSHEEHVMVRP